MATMTRTWVGVRACGIPLMSISFMSALMLSSMAMVSLEKNVKILWKLKSIYPRLSTKNIRKYRDCVMNVGSCPTVFLDPGLNGEDLIFLKIFRFVLTFLCVKSRTKVEAVVREDWTQWVENNSCNKLCWDSRGLHIHTLVHTQQVFGGPKVLVLVDPGVEDHEEDEDAVVGDDCHPGAELTIIPDVHEHAEQGDSWNAVAGGFQQQADHVRHGEGLFFVSVPAKYKRKERLCSKKSKSRLS